MVLTSTGIIAVQHAPKMSAPIISIPWRHPSCLLPLPSLSSGFQANSFQIAVYGCVGSLLRHSGSSFAGHGCFREARRLELLFSCGWVPECGGFSSYSSRVL